MNPRDFVYKNCQQEGFKAKLSERDSNEIAAQCLRDYDTGKVKAKELFKKAETMAKTKRKVLNGGSRRGR